MSKCLASTLALDLFLTLTVAGYVAVCQLVRHAFFADGYGLVGNGLRRCRDDGGFAHQSQCQIIFVEGVELQADFGRLDGFQAVQRAAVSAFLLGHALFGFHAGLRGQGGGIADVDKARAFLIEVAYLDVSLKD